MSKEILRMGGGRIINIGRINKLVQKATTERMSEYYSGSIQDALSSVCEDPRLSDDPLVALAAVMRHHRLGILCQSDQGDWAADEDMVVVRDDGGGMLDKLLVVDYAALWAESLTAGDIKPEQ